MSAPGGGGSGAPSSVAAAGTTPASAGAASPTTTGGAGSGSGGGPGAADASAGVSGSQQAGATGMAGTGGVPASGASGAAGAAGASGTSGSGAAAGSGGVSGSTVREVTPPTGNVTCGTAYKNSITALAHDPSLAKYGDTYYVYSTCQTTLQSDPGCASVPKLAPFQASTDELKWVSGGNSMPAVPAWTNALGLSAADIWAPDVHVINGKAYLYYSVSIWGDTTHSAIGLRTNSTLDPNAPNYAWVDQGKVVGAAQAGSGVNAIDPDLFVDDDGRWWLVYGSFKSGIRLVELDSTTGLAKLPFTSVELTSGLGEGAGIIKNNGYYYLFLSIGSCCNGLSSSYEIIYGRAAKVTGPYLNRNGGALSSASEHLLPPGSNGNPGQGGQSFFEEHNQIFMVYHAYQPPAGNPTLNVRPIYFDPNDWVTLDPCKAKGYHP